MNYVQLYQAIQDYAENTEQLFVANIPRFVEEAETRIYNSVNLPSLRKSQSGNLTANNPYLACPDDFLASYSLSVIDNTGTYYYLINKDVNFIREAYPNPSAAISLPKYYSLFGSQTNNTNALTLFLAPTPDTGYAMELNYFYYPPSIVQGNILTFNNLSLVGGANYTNGVYKNISLTGGSGSSATADIVVSGNTVTSVSLRNGGSFYVAGDILSANASDLGALGAGTGFTIPVATINNPQGLSWLGDNYDPALFYGSMREAMIFMKSEPDMVSYYDARYQEAMVELRRLADGLERGDFYRDGQLKIDVSGGARS